MSSTARVQLLPLSETDHADLARLAVSDYIRDRILANQDSTWRVELIADGSFCGIVGLAPLEHETEIVAYLTEAARGRGLATESCRLLIQWTEFFHRTRRLVARSTVENLAAQKTLRTLGFVQVGKSGETLGFVRSPDGHERI